MAKAIPILALLLAYLITILYLAAMCVPWWFTHYYAVGQSNSDFQNNNPGLLRNTGLFSRSNCFIDGSCITGHVIYKNNSNLQWVYTTVLVLMIVGWLPWLLFVHLLHFRSNKNRSENAGKRILLALTALLTMAFLVSAVIVFACGMVYNNRIYRHGLYGDRAVLTAANGLTTIGQHVDDDNNNNNNNANNANGDNVNKRQESPSGILQSISNIVGSASGSVAATFPSSPGTAATQTVVATSPPSSAANTNFNTNADAAINFEDENSFGNNLGAFTYGTMPWGGSDTQVLGAGIPVLYSIAGISPNTIGNNNKRQLTNNDGLSNAYYFPTPYTGAINGTLGYKWGAHAGWYLTILALALIPLVLLLSLLIKTKGKVVTKSRHVERVVTSQPAVVPPQYAQGPAVLPQQPFVPVGNRAL